MHTRVDAFWSRQYEHPYCVRELPSDVISYIKMRCCATFMNKHIAVSGQVQVSRYRRATININVYSLVLCVRK